jgi:hypothetical protein
MAGAVALKADKLRWLPGQKSRRYDIAGFASLIADWPIEDKGVLTWREDVGGPWKTENISLINLITTNLDSLGEKHPIHPDVKPDDGHLMLSYIKSNCSRMKVVKLGLGMKKGKFLALQKGVVTHRVQEFTITPTSFKSPFCIDGDPHDVSKIHVVCLHRALELFYLPPEDETATGGRA